MENRLQNASDIELKAVAYDTLVQIQVLQNQLNAINGELTRRVEAQRKQTAEQVLQSPPSDVIPRTESIGEIPV